MKIDFQHPNDATKQKTTTTTKGNQLNEKRSDVCLVPGERNRYETQLRTQSEKVQLYFCDDDFSIKYKEETKHHFC